MSKKEKVKFILDISKSLVLAFLTGIFGIFAYLVVNIRSISISQLALSVGGALTAS